MKIPEICQYCGGKVVLTDASVLHGKKAKKGEKIYLCMNCNASVGTHKGTDKPMGTLANTVLRLERAEAHRVFDALWRKKSMTRQKAYDWLAEQMSLPKYRTHIACFDIEQCEQVIRICREQEDEEAA